ncbi:hypothetical protein [Pimelobacter sp. 30-1]|uniref:hypothetical protein n=1 Tax=Pimelobacter sp. 30-1 TaxID=2004991 RepID=UPI001C050296|nr:hypothetical protein [Pimelobacter sp. 30-1]
MPDAAVPDEVGDLVAAVLRDFPREVAAAWRFARVVPDRGPDADGAAWICISSESDLDGDARIWLAGDDSESRQHLLLRLADQLQDELVESSAGWGRPLPPCDLHPHHPLQAGLVDDAAVWCCPATGAARFPVGASAP